MTSMTSPGTELPVVGGTGRTGLPAEVAGAPAERVSGRPATDVADHAKAAAAAWGR